MKVEVGEVVKVAYYGVGVVREVDPSGYAKVVFEDGKKNEWASWWFTPERFTKLGEDK
jgi:hypothetical protein